MNRYADTVKACWAVLFALTLTACGATTAVKDVFTTITKADLVIRATDNVNPDMNARPSPISVRIYELKSATAFNNADFFALYDRDVAELATDLISRDDVELKPGETRELNRELSLDTRYLGIVAAYRNIDLATWKKVVPIEPDSNSDILIVLNDSGVQVTKQ